VPRRVPLLDHLTTLPEDSQLKYPTDSRRTSVSIVGQTSLLFVV